jgi:diamine N-acetyltransferase
VRVQAERLQWVASREPVALMILAKSFVRPDGQVWHPFVITDDGRIVGVVAVGADAVTPQTAWIHHYLIDEREQGRGYGREGLVAIGEWLCATFSEVTRIGLCVLRENSVAWALYSSLGFVEVGETLDGQRILLAEVTDLGR